MFTPIKECMITGHGIDIVDLKRFNIMTDVRLDKLARRICTPEEVLEFENSRNKSQYVAKIWASKEAISKAFGTGIRRDVTWKNIRILNNELGKPEVWLKISGVYCFLSISHEKEFLIASAILGVLNEL